MKFNPFIAAVSVLQILGGLYAGIRGDWRMLVLNVGVGVANSVLATMGK